MRKTFLIVLVYFAWIPSGFSQDGVPWRAAFWNVENLFDIYHDSLKLDEAFTPQGENHWTYKRYADKRNKIYKTIAAMEYPAVIGLAEVENDRVLRDLCQGTPLRRFGYEFVHYDSPDRRGVDCALLYRREQVRLLASQAICVSDSSQDFYTRDILLVELLVGGDSCYIFVNHWPSKLGGTTADVHRLAIARRLLLLMDSIQHQHPKTLVLAMGDFNSAPEEEAVSYGMGFGTGNANEAGFFNLMQSSTAEGSYNYQGTWSCIDQVFANRKLEVEVFAPEFLLMPDQRHLGKKPQRTYIGMRYQGGFSDHLPIIITIQ